MYVYNNNNTNKTIFKINTMLFTDTEKQYLSICVKKIVVWYRLLSYDNT